MFFSNWLNKFSIDGKFRDYAKEKQHCETIVSMLTQERRLLRNGCLIGAAEPEVSYKLRVDDTWVGWFVRVLFSFSGVLENLYK